MIGELKLQEDYIAHVRKNDDGTWSVHSMSEHLQGTANLAKAFASKFDSSEWGKIAGQLHDAGKCRDKWQKYLKRKSGYDETAHLEGIHGKMPHAIHGASYAESRYGKTIGRIFGYSIAGHHAGLPDWSSAEGEGQSALNFQLQQVKTPDMADIELYFKDKVQLAPIASPPWKFNDGLDFSLWIRMMYSCLVDADFLDTESFMNNEQVQDRGNYLTMVELMERCNSFFAAMDKSAEDTPVNKIRRTIRNKCFEAATREQGVFTLSVPTGGGKTLSSLAFGINHAIKHKLDRIIYVIPYTSIIEQNADVFRSVLGNDQVVEHHSSLDEDDASPKSRLAAENWDAPIIVTTSVQFFESLFAAKSSRCRRLHNIANSVVVLDEAQLVPVDYLNPILETMRLLVENYKVTFVISTATQPAFGEKSANKHKRAGLKNMIEIMGDNDEVGSLYNSLKRVEVKFPDDLDCISSWEEITAELKELNQVLCVVSDRKSCRELHALMPEGTFHLSALMCGQHRSEIIERIKEKLKMKQPVRVISTQLVEAGVDMDFPVVYRALAGLDSIAQAAGRCNREGKLAAKGRVIVFNPPKPASIGFLRKASDTTRSLVESVKGDPLAHAVFETYFAELYWKANSLDAKKIVGLLNNRGCEFFFRTAADRFRMIDDALQKSILVRYGEGEKLIETLRIIGPNRSLMRKLQRYTVNIYNNDFAQMLRNRVIEQVHPNIFALASNDDYSEVTGLQCGEVVFDPVKYIFDGRS